MTLIISYNGCDFARFAFWVKPFTPKLLSFRRAFRRNKKNSRNFSQNSINHVLREHLRVFSKRVCALICGVIASKFIQLSASKFIQFTRSTEILRVYTCLDIKNSYVFTIFHQKLVKNQGQGHEVN